MKKVTLYDKEYQWIMCARNEKKMTGTIDTNQYIVRQNKRCLLIDPGGVELFAPMLTAALNIAPIDEITDLFASHQDPDVISSLGLWDKALPKAKLYAPALWEGFIRHFGCNNIEYVAIHDNGGSIKLDGLELQIIPAHYLHSSANFNVYDPNAKILMSGDIGAALNSEEMPIFVENFDKHIENMLFFHQRWMPSNKAKIDWISRVRKLDVNMLVPQHGSIFRGDDVIRFLNWFEALKVGTAIH